MMMCRIIAVANVALWAAACWFAMRYAWKVWRR